MALLADSYHRYGEVTNKVVAYLEELLPMESHPFRTRISQLMQKSRKALRLYSSMGKAGAASVTADNESGEYSEIQVAEWREVNAELLRALSAALAHPGAKRLVSDIFALRDRFHAEWRSREGEIHNSQKALVIAGEQGDFVRAASLARELIIGKARMQACHAAYQELDDVLSQSRVPPPTIELSHEHVETPRPARVLGKVIPIRRQG